MQTRTHTLIPACIIKSALKYGAARFRFTRPAKTNSHKLKITHRLCAVGAVGPVHGGAPEAARSREPPVNYLLCKRLVCCPTSSSSSGFRATEKSNKQTVAAPLLSASGEDYSLPPSRCAAPGRTKETAAAAVLLHKPHAAAPRRQARSVQCCRRFCTVVFSGTEPG